MEELKACYLCKIDAVYTAEDKHQSLPSIGKWRIHCDACGMRTGAFRTEEDVIEAWNTRYEREVLAEGYGKQWCLGEYNQGLDILIIRPDKSSPKDIPVSIIKREV